MWVGWVLWIGCLVCIGTDLCIGLVSSSGLLFRRVCVSVVVTLTVGMPCLCLHLLTSVWKRGTFLVLSVVLRCRWNPVTCRLPMVVMSGSLTGLTGRCAVCLTVCSRRCLCGVTNRTVLLSCLVCLACLTWRMQSLALQGMLQPKMRSTWLMLSLCVVMLAVIRTLSRLLPSPRT